VVEKIAGANLTLIPDAYVGGGAGGEDEQGGLMSLALLQYLTGKSMFMKDTKGEPTLATPSET
jgi:hypothetical protein